MLGALDFTSSANYAPWSITLHKIIIKKTWDTYSNYSGGTPGNSSWGVPPGSPNPHPISDQKLSFFTPVFRPGLLEIMSSLLRLECHQKNFIKSTSNFFLIHLELKQ